jgi:hypothetical protein
MTAPLSDRILEHEGVQSTLVAALLHCSVDDVEDARRLYHRTPRTGRHVLEQPVHSMRDADWALAMRSNSSPFL